MAEAEVLMFSRLRDSRRFVITGSEKWSLDTFLLVLLTIDIAYIQLVIVLVIRDIHDIGGICAIYDKPWFSSNIF